MTSQRAMMLAALAFFIWVLSDTAMKIGCMNAGVVPVPAIMAIVGIIGSLIISTGSLALGRNHALLPSAGYSMHLTMAICFSGNVVANAIAFKHLPLTSFYIVVFTTPLTIAVLSAAMKYEKLTRHKIACLLAGFLGMLLAIGGASGGGDLTGYIAAAMGTICFSTNALLMRKSAKEASVESIQLFNYLCMGLIGCVWIVISNAQMPSLSVLGVIAASGTLLAIGSLCFNTALQNTVATNVAQLHYTQIIYGSITGYLIWNEVPTWSLLFGSGIIICAGLLVARQAKIEDKLTA